MVGKVFCKILNNRLVEHLDKNKVLHEGKLFRQIRVVDNVIAE